ncbi:hypothetical protein [Lactobacillus sp. HT06-2]|uniref:hypothetical protein n=1 Tax=Lactobacillus sp. HT06-2 TaxID=2080222 RepID=UPI001F1C53B0|nr:hypothetical protein [Lactobacillus sp. HT06-2]
MEIIAAIVYAIWTISVIVEVYSNHKNEKSNKELSEEIHKSNEVNECLIDEVKKYANSGDKKYTAQDNLLWECIIILAKHIHDLEDQNYVK